MDDFGMIILLFAVTVALGLFTRCIESKDKLEAQKDCLLHHTADECAKVFQ